MDTFLVETNNILFKPEEQIVVFGEKTGRRANTYIVRWAISDDDIKNHLEKMKKSFGCGGSIKNIDYEGQSDIKAIHLQGDTVVKAGKYIKSLGIKKVLIKEII